MRKEKALKITKTRVLVMCAILIALMFILTRFLSINAASIRIGFSFVPIFIAGWFMGPVPAAIVAVTGDLLGSFLVPTGAFIPGLTLTYLLQGLAFGFIFRGRINIARIAIAVAIHQCVLGLLLNTYWLATTYNFPYTAYLLTRLPQYAVNIPVEFVTMLVLSRALAQVRKRVMPGA